MSGSTYSVPIGTPAVADPAVSPSASRLMANPAPAYAAGGSGEVTGRLFRMLPSRWFPTGPGTRVYALMAGFAAAFEAVWEQIAYARQQARISTMTDGWVDLAAYDFFGTGMRRRQDESDAQLSQRIRVEVMRLRNTRRAVEQAIVDITGVPGTVFEAFNTGDCGGWDTYGFAFDVVGAWGDSELTFQAFANVARPADEGVPVVNGYDGYLGGWDIGSSEWIEMSMITGQIVDADVYAAIAAVAPAGTVIWVHIGEVLKAGAAPLGQFVLDANALE